MVSESMRFLLDVDDVVADLTSQIYLVSGTSKNPEAQCTWDSFQLLDTREEYLVRFFMRSPEFWANVPVKEGAREGVEAILAAGHDIFWVTSPWVDCREWGQVRREWVTRHFPTVDPQNLVVTKSKFLVEGDVFIDDRVENVLLWRKHHPGGTGLLYRVPYVSHLEDLRPTWKPTFTWDDVQKII